MQFFWTIVVLVVLMGICWRFLGSYMAAVFEGRVHWFGWLERPDLPGPRRRAPSRSRAGNDTRGP